jgi:hypothetical protein
MANKTLTEKLESHRLLIFNSSDPQVASLLHTMGIDAGYIKQGQELYNKTMQLVSQQKKEYQEQSLAFDKFHVEKDEATASFNRTFKLIRVLSRNDKNLQDRLKLHNGKAYAIEEWIENSMDFYNRLKNETDFLAKIAKFKITAARINTEMKRIEDLKQLRNQEILEKGQAQEATRLRNEKLEELDDYCAELKAISRMALEEQSQLLEKLGIVVPS